jgi:pantetheine-phosphate adenylyltransferase
MAIYPGSFDPITLGHVDIAERAARIFDKLVLSVYQSASYGSKQTLFSLDERLEMARSALRHLDNVRVDSFSGLAVDYAHSVGANTIVRGLRAVTDFEYEFKYAHMNRHLAPDIEFVCLMTNAKQSFVSSSFIREVASLGGDVRGLVPDGVADALEHKFGAATRD